MKRKIDLDSDDDNSSLGTDDTGFFEACEENDKEYIDLVIKSGKADWNVGLMGACQSGNKELVDFMIEKGANKWNDALFHACMGDNATIAKYMIEKGATDLEYGLEYACKVGGPSMIHVFIDLGGVDWKEIFDAAYYEGYRDLFVMSYYRILNANIKMHIDINISYTSKDDCDMKELLLPKNNKPCKIIDIRVKLFDRNLLKSK